MNTNYLVFDIETSSLPDSELEVVKPEFKPAANLKDPDKIKASIEEKKLAWKEDAALSALTGKVVAIGFRDKGGDFLLFTPLTEHQIIRDFWHMMINPITLVGFNSNSFDLPFLIRRSWKLGIPIPYWLREGRYFSKLCVDLKDLWQLGDRQAHGTLAQLAVHFGLPGKLGSGKDFAKLLETDPESAREYLKRDLEITDQLYLKMR